MISMYDTCSCVWGHVDVRMGCHWFVCWPLSQWARTLGRDILTALILSLPCNVWVTRIQLFFEVQYPNLDWVLQQYSWIGFQYVYIYIQPHVYIYIHYMWLYVHIYIYTWLYNSKIWIIHCFQFWDWWTAGRLHPTLPRSWLKSSSPGMEKSTKRSLELKWHSFWSCRQWPFKYHKFVEKKQTFMIIYGMYHPIYNHLYINAIYIYNLTIYYHHL